jgi:hypothetical protein
MWVGRFLPLVTRTASDRRNVLTDHRIKQERWAREERERRSLPLAFGIFIAGLASWDWFFNPLSFRDEPPDAGPPLREVALRRIEEYLSLIQKHAGQPIGWVIAEEYGRLGGRYHCHLLVAGVRHLPRDFWRREANRRFGFTRIELFHPTRGAAYYAAKYEGRRDGEVRLGGTLAGTDLSRWEESRSQGGGRDVAISSALGKSYFHMGLGRWHR